MTPSALQAWLDRMGWNQAAANRALFNRRSGALNAMVTGRSQIPKRVEIECLLIEAVAKDSPEAWGRLIALGRRYIADAGKVKRCGRKPGRVG